MPLEEFVARITFGPSDYFLTGGSAPPHALSPMIRKAFVMFVNPGCEAEYANRHKPIWKELSSVLKAHGVHNYSIFFDQGTRQCFAYVEIEDEARWGAIAQTEVCQRWWSHMSSLMTVNPDKSPASLTLNEVFHLD